MGEETLRQALETIESLCDEEIKKRFKCNSLSEEICAGKSHIYHLLAIPRNIAREALEKAKQAQRVTKRGGTNGGRPKKEPSARGTCYACGHSASAHDLTGCSACHCGGMMAWPENGGRKKRTETPITYCPACGYTEADARLHMDHNRCTNAGNAPWEK